LLDRFRPALAQQNGAVAALAVGNRELSTLKDHQLGMKPADGVIGNGNVALFVSSDGELP
jgi:hypothetical protein